jgi:hypothetical protein
MCFRLTARISFWEYPVSLSKAGFKFNTRPPAFDIPIPMGAESNNRR